MHVCSLYLLNDTSVVYWSNWYPCQHWMINALADVGLEYVNCKLPARHWFCLCWSFGTAFRGTEPESPVLILNVGIWPDDATQRSRWVACRGPCSDLQNHLSWYSWGCLIALECVMLPLLYSSGTFIFASLNGLLEAIFQSYLVCGWKNCL